MNNNGLKSKKRFARKIAKAMFLALLVGVFSVSSIAAADREVTEQERACHEFLNAFFNVQLTDAKEFFEEMESEAAEIVAEDEEKNTVISYDSQVLQAFIEDKFAMLSDDAEERLIMNRVISRLYEKSCEADSSIIVLSQIIEAAEEENAYRYEVELLAGLSTEVIEGSISLESADGQWNVSDFLIYEK